VPQTKHSHDWGPVRLSPAPYEIGHTHEFKRSDNEVYHSSSDDCPGAHYHRHIMPGGDLTSPPLEMPA
jgi:hypothetical protein